jgi:hypothetical protein
VGDRAADNDSLEIAAQDSAADRDVPCIPLAADILQGPAPRQPSGPCSRFACHLGLELALSCLQPGDGPEERVIADVPVCVIGAQPQ